MAEEELRRNLLGGLFASAVAASLLNSSSSDDDDDDDSGDPDFSKEYLNDWKVEKNTVGTKLKEILKAFRKVNEAGTDLIQNPSKYNAILQVLIRLPFQRQPNPLVINRVKFFDALLQDGLLHFYKSYWTMIKDKIGDWDNLILCSIGQAVINYGRSLTAMWNGVGLAKEHHMSQMCHEFLGFMLEQLDLPIMKKEHSGLGNHQGMVVNAMIRILSCMAVKSYEACEMIQSLGGVELITHYLCNYDDDGIKINSFMLLACVAPTKHACIKALEAHEEQMKFLITQLEEAVCSASRSTDQYDLEELVPPVSNCMRLSIVMNKKFMQFGALTFYDAMLDESFPLNATKMSIEGIGIMMDNQSSRALVKEDRNCKQLLEHHAAVGAVLSSTAQNILEKL